jgi:hypothetical protein
VTFPLSSIRRLGCHEPLWAARSWWVWLAWRWFEIVFQESVWRLAADNDGLLCMSEATTV